MASSSTPRPVIEHARRRDARATNRLLREVLPAELFVDCDYSKEEAIQMAAEVMRGLEAEPCERGTEEECSSHR